MPAIPATITMNVRAELVWVCQPTKRGTVVALCDPLGLTVEADDAQELPSLIAEAHHFLMVDLFEDGELPRFLQDHGWTPNRPLPQQLPEGGVKFDVPFRVEPLAHGHT